MCRLLKWLIVICVANAALTGCIYDYPPEDCIVNRDLLLTVRMPPDWTDYYVESSRGAEPRAMDCRLMVSGVKGIVTDTVVRLYADGISVDFGRLPVSGLSVKAWVSAAGAYVVDPDWNVSLSDSLRAVMSHKKEAWTAVGDLHGDVSELYLVHATSSIVIVTNDLSAFTDTGHTLKVSIIYPDLQPSVFSVTRNEAFDSELWPPVISAIEIGSGSLQTIGRDFFFINDASRRIRFRVEVSNQNGETLSRSPVLDVEVERGRRTIVTGPFLTWREHPGVSVSPDFSGKFNYEILN